MRFETAAVAAPVLAIALGLAACGSEKPEPAPTTEASRSATEAAAQDGTFPAGADNGYASAYTDFDLEKCKVLKENREEGSSADYACPGYESIPLLVQEGDGRFDLDAGIDDGGFQTLSAFNEIADTVEWRMTDGKPFAVIFRFRDVAGETPDRTVLAVETIGREGAPGCRLAQISGDTPEANQRARAIADSASGGISTCPEQPRMVGNAS